jgi:hypothetical protein
MITVIMVIAVIMRRTEINLLNCFETFTPL